MSGYAFMLGSCAACAIPIMFHPHKVPSLRVNGVKQPICRACAERWNQIHRIDKGLEPVPIQEGAYEPFPEEEL